MRDLDQKQLIKSDFVCVYGDVVANIPLDDALAAHRARRTADKNNIMTMVLREAGNATKATENDGVRAYHRTQAQHPKPCFVLDPVDGRCLHYEQVHQHSGHAHPRLNIPEEVFTEHAEADIRQDLIDCGIDICTPATLAQWSDNFDWQAPRSGFLRGVLKDHETFGLNIHAHVVGEGGYAARVKDWKAYEAVSRDVVGRWAYPIAPDANLLPDQTYQLLRKGNVYRESGIVLSRSCTVERMCVLGKATSVGEGTVITNSVIGRRCVIGSRVRIDGAFIWDDARIGDDAVVTRAAVGNEASVGKRCIVEPGAMISYGVSLAPGTKVDQNTRVTRVKRKRDDEEEVVYGEDDAKVVGQGGVGFRLELDEDEEDVVNALLAGVQHIDLDLVAEDPISDLDSDSDEFEEVDHHRLGSRSESFGSIGSDESGDARHRAADFHHEAVNSIFDSLQKNEDPDTIQLELTALTLSSNAEAKQVRRAVAVAFSKRMANMLEGDKVTPKDAVAATIAPNQRLIKGCVDVKVVEEQADFLLLLQNDLVHRQQGEKLLLFASNALATGDLIEAEGFEAWWEDPRSSATEELERVRAETKQLVDVLVGDDESEEEDSEDDEEEDDDSE